MLKNTQTYYLAFCLFLFMQICGMNVYGQNYALDLSDTSTYDINCGKVVPSAWTVKLDSCELHTPSLETSNSDPSWMKYTVRINQSGNLNFNDNAYIQHQINEGVWVNDTSLSGLGLDAVFSLTDSIFMGIGDVFRIRVIFETDDNTQFFQLKNGDIQVYDAIVSGTGSTVMPVEFMYFNLKRDGNFIDINWATASETNNYYFSLEKSEDAYRFDSINYIHGKGNSNYVNKYNLTDIANTDKTIYYRLKQVDFDGKYEYSDIITTSGKDYKEMMDIVINNSEYSLVVCCKEETTLKLNIINATTGQVQNQIDYNVPQGENYIPLNEIITQPGIYCISSKINNNFFSKLIPFNQK